MPVDVAPAGRSPLTRSSLKNYRGEGHRKACGSSLSVGRGGSMKISWGSHPPSRHVHTLLGFPQLLLCWKPRKIIQPFSGAGTEYACSFLSFQTLIKQCIYCMERFSEKRKILLHFIWIQKAMDTSGCAWKEEVFFWFHLTFKAQLRCRKVLTAKIEMCQIAVSYLFLNGGTFLSCAHGRKFTWYKQLLVFH